MSTAEELRELVGSADDPQALADQLKAQIDLVVEQALTTRSASADLPAKDPIIVSGDGSSLEAAMAPEAIDSEAALPPPGHGDSGPPGDVDDDF